MEGLQGLSITRRRDLRSAVNRIAALLDDDPGRIALDIPAIGAKLAAISPVAAGLSIKSFSNVKSDFMAAVKASKLKPLQGSGKTPMSPAWINLVAQFPHKRDRIGLSRLARYASAMNISPEQVDDGVINNFIAAVRDGSLHRKPNALHRMVTRLWNEAARQPGRKLQAVAVPSFRPPVKRIGWLLLTRSLSQRRRPILGLVQRIRCVRRGRSFTCAKTADPQVAARSDSCRRQRTHPQRR